MIMYSNKYENTPIYLLVTTNCNTENDHLASHKIVLLYVSTTRGAVMLT